MALTYAATCDALEAEVQRFTEAADGADMDAAVPMLFDAADATAPMRLQALIVHLGTIHRWATKMVAERLAEPISRRGLADDLPADVNSYPAWLRAGGQSMVDVFRAADPDAAVWAWGSDHHARWWPRRQLHETMVHRADMERALGREPAFDPALAVDGIDEFLENLPYARFAQGVKNLKGNGSLHFHCTDVAGEWLIQLTPDGFTCEHGHAKADVAVRGTAGDLLLLVWGRFKPVPPDRFQVFGDQALLDFWLEHSAL